MVDNRNGADRYILQVGWTGMEGSLALIKANERIILDRLDRDFVENYTVLSENIIKRIRAHMLYREEKFRYICEMGTGGVWGALWKLSGEWDCGLRINMKKLPLRQETIEICEITGENPYTISAGGSFLIVDEKMEGIKDMMETSQIPCEVIGKLTGGRDKLLVWGHRTSCLNSPGSRGEQC